jgi:V8-like Glu-specific endopeptidase
MRMFLFLWLAGVVGVSSLSAQIDSIPRTVEAPKEAFLENAPLAEFAFEDELFERRQLRLREHYLPTPLGPMLPVPEVAADVEPPRQTALDAELGSVIIRQNKALTDSETSNSTSTVCEPSIAVRGNEILYTGNWFAAFSRDGGANFAYRNPYTMFPATSSRPFCCDQVAIYVPSHDMMIWFLQYVNDGNGNLVRIAVASGADIANERWRYYDFTPQNVGNWTGEWFDYPDLAYSNSHLFVTTNCFTTAASSFTRAVCLRIPLEQLRTYGALNYHYFDRTDVGSLRPTQGAGNTMYIGTHESLNSLRVYQWDDASTNIQQKSFGVRQWVRGYTSPTTQLQWLNNIDGRITGAWANGSRPSFAWTSGSDATFAQPNVRVAELDYPAGTVVGQPHIWNAEIAFAYPAMTVNSSGAVGLALSYGSSALPPSAAVGFRDGAAWNLVGVATGTHRPTQNRWGDYLTIRRNGADQNRFAAASFSLAGGQGRGDIVARLVQFDVSRSESAPTPAEVAESTVTITRPVTSIMMESAPVEEKLNGFKFSAKTQQDNSKRSASVKKMIQALDGGNESFEKTMTLIPLTETETIETYSDISNLRDIGEFFFEIPETVCLPDERVQVTDTTAAPWNGNCQLIITTRGGLKGRGTGWFLSPTVVVTAGHCVHEGADGEFFPEIEVIPAMNGPVRPYGSQTVNSSAMRTTNQWKQFGSVVHDYAVIILPTPVDGVTTTPAMAMTDADLAAANLELSGYPADKETGTQWFHFGVPTSLTAGRIFYTIDTYGGHSGSAVTTNHATGRVAVGIHNYGSCPNKCTRITQDVLNDIQTWTQP